jgi:hypothetical protein
MGVYDRPYMREPAEPLKPAPRARRPEPVSTAPWWSRFRFRLWLLFHPRRGAGGKDPGQGAAR